MAKLFSQLSVIGESSSPVSGPLARTRNAIRRNKWRLRPLKRFVLPLRNSKRQMLTLLRTVTPGLEAPPAIEPSTSAYLGRHASHSHREVHSSEPVRTLPHPFEQSNGQHGAGVSAPAHLFELADIDFWPRYGGCVVTADRKLLADLSPEVWGIENHAIFSQLRLPDLEYLPGRTAIVVTPEAVGNYYHWLIDLVPRLLLLKEAEEGFDAFDRVLINGSGARYERESLEALGLPSEKIRYVNERQRFHIQAAVVPSMDHAAKVIAPWKMKALRDLRDALPHGGRPRTRRLYVSRRNAAVRRIVNEEALRPLLEQAGFTLLELDARPWIEQVQMFADAEVVLAPHGAALANIAFCQPGALITEITTRGGYRDFYRYLAASASLQYDVLEGEARVAANGSTIRAVENEDMIVTDSALQQWLQTL